MVRGTRLPGYVNLAASVVVLVVVATLALRVAGATTPAIAEFAPEASHTIQQAPSEQTAQNGNGQGGAAGAPVLPSPSPTPPTLPAGAVFLRCVGDPPRQTEDPQSPPCIPYWTGDNGGSTSRGVTGSSITVAITPMNSGDLTPGYNVIKDFINRRFELYGRQIVYQTNQSSSAGSCSATGMEANAEIAAQLKAFAASNYNFCNGFEQLYYDDLANKGVVNATSSTVIGGEANLTRHQPYSWSYLPGPDVAGVAAANWICSTLAGGTADYAGLPQKGQPRKWGILTYHSAQGSPDRTGLLNGLAACGIQPMIEDVQFDDSTNGFDGMQTAIAAFQSSGVTSIIPFAQAIEQAYSSDIATKQGYYPEWIFTPWGETDEDWDGRVFDPSQLAHSFGLSPLNKRTPFSQQPCQMAAQEVQPGFQWPSRLDGAYSNYKVCEMVYESLLMIASGIQMAGPHLTPASFQSGLFRAAWPNPTCGDAPYYQACVQFGPGHTMNSVDTTPRWWNPAATSYEYQGTQSGAWCYIDKGRRYRFGTYPKGREGLFSGPCY